MSQLEINYSKYLSYLIKNKKVNKIAIAVSGGPDSIALLFLTYKWSKDLDISLIVITVNHNLRPSSKKEALNVANTCKKINIQHIILNSYIKKSTSSIEKKAREERYNLITNYCKKHHINILLTGQTMDDLIENFFIRLSRASGILGLSSNVIMKYRNLEIIRPLSKTSKEIIINYLNDNNINYNIDETNLDPNFCFRNEIRNKIKYFLDSKFISSNLYKNRIFQTICNIDKDFYILKKEFNDFFNTKVTISKLGFATIKKIHITKENKNIMHYIISYLLTIIGGNNFTPKSSKILQILEKLYCSNKNFCMNFHKTIIRSSSDVLIFYKEPKEFKIHPDLNNIIDNKFLIENIPDNHKLIQLSKDEFNNIKKENKNISNIIKNQLYNIKDILFTIPVLKNLEKNIIIPHINYGTNNTKIKVSFTPYYQSKFLF